MGTFPGIQARGCHAFRFGDAVHSGLPLALVQWRRRYDALGTLLPPPPLCFPVSLHC